MEKINISELLRDCPTGMELDCVMYQDVYFDYVDTLNIIHCYIQHETHKSSITFNQFGTPNSDIKSKCVIFPKGKTSWHDFTIPFKDGDIVAYQDDEKNSVQIFIFKEYITNEKARCYAFFDDENFLDINENTYYVNRLATDEEKEIFFKAIKDNGYKWDEYTKTFEKLNKTKSKFNISSLTPFESKVLVRSENHNIWKPALFGFFIESKKYYYAVGGTCWTQCIPYDGNEYLLATTDDCDEYYKTWEMK
jgi:hypothetical protein